MITTLQRATGATRIYRAVAIFLIVIMVGTLGYVILEGADPVTSLYMTVITVASVGYEEAVHLDTKGRLFTILVILAGLGSWTYLTVTVIAFFVEGEFRKLFRERAIHKRIAKMKNHFIICGLGQAGRSVLTEFMVVKSPCLVIDKDPVVVEEIMEHYTDLVALVGDATTDEMLEQAGIERARGLVAATESDSDNLLIVLTARSKNPEMTITARATRIENYDKLRVAGANHVIMPNVIGGVRMAATLLRPNVIDFLDVMMRGSGEPMRLEDACIPKGSPLVAKCLSEVEIPKKTGMLVLAIKHASGQYIYSPPPSEQFEADDTLIVLGPAEKVSALEKLLAGKI